ncbi:hypothetical protein [Nocardia veterana]|uniref:Uncharacterized protein n=1 Tax=Nocardia veterana TaxID=132249 RepID=A0A7X6M4S2_9NOCA|nr:hypothetical protein [Nocardia veterana]NKY89819.1 hypothetical protein [Nocardia veterana]
MDGEAVAGIDCRQRVVEELLQFREHRRRAVVAGVFEWRESTAPVSLLCPGSVHTRIGENAEKAQAKLLRREPDAAVMAQNSALLATGADPDRVGEQVVEALQTGQFLIITHREWEPLVVSWNREVERTFAEWDGRYGADVSAQMLVAGANPVSS